jgi:polyhydroxyalkanoate synthase
MVVSALPRLGPRPLPLHLATALLTCASSESAWRLWSAGSPSSSLNSSSLPAQSEHRAQNGPPQPSQSGLAHRNASPPSADLPSEVSHAALTQARWAMAPLMTEITAALAAAPAGGAALPEGDAFVAALRREATRRLSRLAEGIAAYRRSSVRRDLPEAPTVWEEGSTQLLDYARFSERESHDGLRPLLLVPSLINRWHVLDLSAERSLVRALARAGLRPYVVDWGDPGPIERAYDCAGYVRRLERAIAHVRRSTGQRVAVLGYCMGGLLSMGAAQRAADDVDRLVLMASPWDFHADRAGQSFIVAFGPQLAKLAEVAGELPVDVLQMLFWSLDPWQVIRKFERFAAAAPDAGTTRDFVLLEDWLNGGAALAGPVARECLLGWYGENLPGRGEWKIDDVAIRPDRIGQPTLVLIPSGDRIVPPASAAAVCGPNGLPRADRRDLPLGHIGMVTSGRAPDLCWAPLVRWLTGEGA